MIVKSADALNRMLSTAKGVLAFDTETVGVAPPGCVDRGKEQALQLDRSRLIVFSACWKTGDKLESVAVPVAEMYGPEFMSRSQLFGVIKPYMADESLLKVAHHMNYDANVMLNHGVEVRNMGCTLIEGRCFDENLPAGLKDRAPMVGMMLRRTSMIDFSNLEETAKYADEDALACMKLHLMHQELAGSDKYPAINKHLYETMERPLLKVVVDMERRGMHIDQAYLMDMDKVMRKERDEKEALVYKAFGKTFNLRSPKQLSELLFTTLGLKPPDDVKETATGQMPTSEKVLFAMQNQHPGIAAMLDFRHIAKLYDTYINSDTGIASYADANGFIHCTLSQTGAVTFRFSCSLPY